VGKNITPQSAGLALNGTEGGRPARQLSEEVRTRQLMTGAAVHDPERHFATVICRIAKGSFEHLVDAARPLS